MYMRVTTQTSDIKRYLKFSFINFYFFNEKYMLNTCYIVIYKIHFINNHYDVTLLCCKLD